MAAHAFSEDVSERWVTLDDYRLRFLYCNCQQMLPQLEWKRGERVGGPPAAHPCRSGPPILLIHGLLGYSFSWRHNLCALAQCGPVYAVDLPGAGFSDRPRQIERTLSGIASVVLRSLEALGIGQFSIVGTSYGGAMAMALAALVPQRISRLVLVDPVNPWSEPTRQRTRWLATAYGRILFRCLSPFLRPLKGYFLARMYGDPRRIVPGVALAYAAPLRIPGTYDHLFEVIRTWQADVQALEKVLPRIAELPTLLVWGSRDAVVSVRSAGPLRRQFSAAELVVLEGAGHLPYEEVPEEFNRVVCDFLSR
jgi:pimeloyl-ACP methyl ester carboxylesterase